jgi:aspartyl-tRNA(Asn)/glutamyl-tRNA(Gln) amidotransferase subunit C
MPLSRIQVEHIARLARLSLSDSEITRFTEELTAIVGYIDQLQQVDTNGVVLSGQSDSNGLLRPDLVRPSLPTDRALANAPAAEGGFFRVPKVIG